jgi:hypothetical protein
MGCVGERNKIPKVDQNNEEIRTKTKPTLCFLGRRRHCFSNAPKQLFFSFDLKTHCFIKRELPFFFFLNGPYSLLLLPL